MKKGTTSSWITIANLETKIKSKHSCKVKQLMSAGFNFQGFIKQCELIYDTFASLSYLHLLWLIYKGL